MGEFVGSEPPVLDGSSDDGEPVVALPRARDRSDAPSGAEDIPSSPELFVEEEVDLFGGDDEEEESGGTAAEAAESSGEVRSKNAKYAVSIDHLMDHRVKNPFCPHCTRAKTTRERRTHGALETQLRVTTSSSGMTKETKFRRKTRTLRCKRSVWWFLIVLRDLRTATRRVPSLLGRRRRRSFIGKGSRK